MARHDDDIGVAESPAAEDFIAEKVKGADILLSYVDPDAPALDAETNRRLVRKIDIYVLPWLCGLYILQYIDKGVLSYSSVMGILTDAHLTSSQFTWLGSIYYLGYMVALAPHNRLLQVFAPSRYIACCMMIWGLILALMSVCNSFTSLMIQRCFLGCFEAVVNCGFVLVTASWYKKSEHGVRVSIWSSCNGLATIVGALIAWGCLTAQTDGLKSALPSWKIMAVCLGCVSVVYGACMWYFMPGSMLEAKFYSEEEKRQAVERMRENHQGIGSHKFKWYQAREAFLDIRTWLYVLFVMTSQMPSAGISLLFSLLIKSLNYDNRKVLLLGMPAGGLQIVFQNTFGYIADRTKQRSLTALVIQIISLGSAALLVGLGNVAPLFDRPGQLAAYWIMLGSCSIGYYLVLALVASNVIGTTKKTTTNVILFLSMAAAFLIGPQIWRDPPYYHNAKYACLGLWIASVIILVILYFLNRLENAKRDRENTEPAPEGIEFFDLTDKENKHFRYVI